jgi:uroporphyrinogen-III decarboxylase
VWKIFERQCEIALANLAKIHHAVGDRVSAVFLTGTDFGTQRGPFIDPRTYRDLYQPFHKAVNDWVHQHTAWKTFIHTCGSVWALIEDFIESGFDVLNPVQCSAADMAPRDLKATFGDRLVFWGGGVDTQKTLPFGSPADIRAEVRDRIQTFSPGGGFVFNTVHNVQARTPRENLTALYDAFRQHRTL